MKLRILIGCECSGVVRDAFNAMGHEAFSCDLLPSKTPGPHFQQDLLELLRMTRGYWHLGIFHPPCDFLANCAAWAFKDADYSEYPGVGYHQKVKPGTLVGEARREARRLSVEFFLDLWNCGIPFVCIENPVGHMNSHPALPCPQIIQPHQFGDDASKATCLWLKGLPRLLPTGDFPPRLVEWPKGSGIIKRRWSNQTDSGQNNLSPSEDRAATRAATYPGIARAMAQQWGSHAQRIMRLAEREEV